MVDEKTTSGSGCTCGPSAGRKDARGHEHTAAEVARIRALTGHFEQWIGPVSQVIHEKRSELVHVDVYAVAPQPGRDCVTLFTTGMSARPMRGGCGHASGGHAELVMSLPPDWRVEPRWWTDERHFWPIREITALARYPHRLGTRLGYGHTLADGRKPRAIARGTRFCALALFPSVTLPPEVHWATGPDGEAVDVLAVYPIYREELELKLRFGPDALWRRLRECGVTDVLDVARPNTAVPGVRSPPLRKSA